MGSEQKDQSAITLNNVHTILGDGVDNDHYFKLDIPKNASIKEDAGKSYILKVGEIYAAKMNFKDLQHFTEAYETLSYNEFTLQAVAKPIDVTREFSDGLVTLVLSFGP